MQSMGLGTGEETRKASLPKLREDLKSLCDRRLEQHFSSRASNYSDRSWEQSDFLLSTEETPPPPPASQIVEGQVA